MIKLLLFIIILNIICGIESLKINFIDDSRVLLVPPNMESYNVYYQSHSWDDLDEYDQMYRKGVQFNKVDVHYMYDEEFCKSQLQVNQKRLYNGCFVLSHDLPTSSTQYNSTDNLIDYIIDNKERWYSNTVPKKYISLCFKLDTYSPCDGSQESLDFINAANCFLSTEILGLIQEYEGDLNLEFILDGSAAPLNCLSNHWKFLNSTWINDPEEALYSNNGTLGYEQFQIADLPAEYPFESYWIDQLCRDISPPFGKFRNSSYPILIWEPSNQDHIQSIVESYYKCINMFPEFNDFTNLRFAGNIDPVQFQIYSSNEMNGVGGWNLQIECYNQTHEFHIYEDGVFNQKIISMNLETVNFIFIFFKNSSNSNDIYYHLYTTKEILSDLVYLNTFKLIDSISTPFQDLQVVQIFNITNQNQINNYLFISDNQFTYLIFTLNLETFQFTLLNFGKTLPNPPTTSSPSSSSSSILSKLYLLNNNNEFIIFEYYIYQDSNMIINIWNLGINLNENNTISLLKSLPFNGIFNGLPMIESFDLIHYFNKTDDGESDEMMIMMILSTDVKSIYGCLISIDSNMEPNSIVNPVFLDVGSDISISILEFNGTSYVMEVHSHGYCFNTESNNKRPSPRVCEQVPEPYYMILNYNYGTIDNWLYHISISKTPLSSCDQYILHGTYDQGSYPSVHLYQGYQSSDPLSNSIGVIEIHQGIPIDYIDFSECGIANHWNQIVLDSWSLPNLNL